MGLCSGRSKKSTYGLVIPYYKLKIYKGRAEEYSIYKDNSTIKVAAKNKSTHAFFKKIANEKIKNMPPSIDDL